MKRLLLPLFVKIARSLGIDEIQRRLDELSEVSSRVDHAELLANDSFTVAQLSEERANTYTNEQAHSLNQQIIKLQTDLVFHIDQKQLQLIQALDSNKAEVGENILRIEKTIAELRLNLDALRRSQVDNFKTSAPHADYLPTSAVQIDEVMYLALEDKFRGDRDIVGQRQVSYLKYLGTTISSTTPLLDLGCGRGEWLQALRRNNIPSVGVDGNAVCVAECTEAGLSVQLGDIMTFLRNSDDASFGAVTLFQVFEHLTFADLLDVMREIRRVLVKGGVLIGEIPNSKNLRVGSSTFWIDPTHQRPLFPDVLMFLAEQIGFENVDGIYVNRLGPEHDLSGLPEGALHALASVLEAVDGPGDFALIARS
jgi:O-antigen chain-terminating methyltransferase